MGVGSGAGGGDRPDQGIRPEPVDVVATTGLSDEAVRRPARRPEAALTPRQPRLPGTSPACDSPASPSASCLITTAAGSPVRREGVAYSTVPHSGLLSPASATDRRLR